MLVAMREEGGTGSSDRQIDVWGEHGHYFRTEDGLGRYHSILHEISYFLIILGLITFV
jgi:hypothetical protein